MIDKKKFQKNDLKKCLKIAQKLYWHARKLNKDKNFDKNGTDALVSSLENYMDEMKIIIESSSKPREEDSFDFHFKD